MNFKMLVPTLLIFQSLNAAAFHEGLFKRNHKSMGKNLKFMSREDSSKKDESLWFDQTLDHSSSSSKTFKQRYFVDSKYAKTPDAPVFFLICGEWNCQGTNSYSSISAIAKRKGAHLVALEHRYYGQSLPFMKLTTENLQYLNLEAAIADLANFQRFMMKEKGLNGKWIAFGGSYAGTLSAFYRLKHPELVTGSLASSAPVLMKAEFSEYDAHVAKVINKSSCGDKVREAVALIENEMLTAEGTKKVKQIFESSDVRDDRDFLYVIADMLAAAVQYGKDDLFCSQLTNSTDLIRGYAKGGLAVLNSMGSRPVEISLQVAEKVEVTENDFMRQWMWQSCYEFGWFQVANSGKATSRSKLIDLKYHEDVCQRLYQTNMRADGMLNAEWYLPLFDPQTSHIIFTNGTNDPWLTLSVIPGEHLANEGLDLIMIEDAAHCDDLKVTRDAAIMKAQAQLERIIESWIE